jgi:hypothetical protein
MTLRQGGREIALPARDEELAIDNAAFEGLAIGTGHLRGDEVVAEPMSFADKNAVALADLRLTPNAIMGEPAEHAKPRGTDES